MEARIFIPVLVIFIFGSIYSILVSKKNNNEKDAYLLKYPEAVKVIIDKFMISGNLKTIKIHRVNGEKPVFIEPGNIDAFLCKPGENFIEASIENSDRLYTLELDAIRGKSYILTYDENETELKINELK